MIVNETNTWLQNFNWSNTALAEINYNFISIMLASNVAHHYQVVDKPLGTSLFYTAREDCSRYCPDN